jgi:hypothetical protein
MESELIELTACLASLEQMIKKSALFCQEYENRRGTYPPVEQLEHVISFPELRSLDLLCKDSIERYLPDNIELTEKWHVYGNKGSASPDEVYDDLIQKRTYLIQAINIIRARNQITENQKEFSEQFLPKGYKKLVEPINLFFEDTKQHCQDYDKNVFIMTRYQAGNMVLKKIDNKIRETLRVNGLHGHRADDKCYLNDRNLWDNVCTYMFCCKYGIAVLEDILVDEFNPNVALEYGFMRALGKPTLLLKEKRFKPRADILGTIWEEFDILDFENSINEAINRWLNDINVYTK